MTVPAYAWIHEHHLDVEINVAGWLQVTFLGKYQSCTCTGDTAKHWMDQAYPG